jgi:heat-inducible transcriptional repressor
VGLGTEESLELTDRQRDILQAVIEEYIATAEPVGSRTLTKRRALHVSPATVRNTMADLEDLGLLSAPHASAGRLPTPIALRFYIEKLAPRGRISTRDRELIRAVTQSAAHSDQDLSEVLHDAGRVLSAVSKHAALVLMPTLEEIIFDHIDFAPVGGNRILAIFVAKSGFIRHRLVYVDMPIERDELSRMSNYLRSLLGGKTLAEVRGEIAREMASERSQADLMMQTALSLGDRALAHSETQGIVVAGERTLLDQPEFRDLVKMRQVLRAFEEKTVLLMLLGEATREPIEAQAASSATTAVVLGHHTRIRELSELDLASVVATYAAENGPSGRVGIVGPARMDYSRVIPLVELTAEALSGSLSAAHRKPYHNEN